MPRKRRQSRIPTPAWERPHGALGSRVLGLPPRVYATLGVAALVALALGIIAYTVISDEIADRNRPGSTVLAVDDRDFSLEYFTSRVETFIQQNGGPGVVRPENYSVAVQSVQEQLIEEQILLRFAGEKGQAATEDEVNQEIATRMNINVDDPNFGTRFQEELTRSGLDEEEYRETATASVLRRKVLEKFTSEVPPTAESVHYRLIAVSEETEANALRTQIEGGADFAALAKEKSLDTATKEIGGDAGWVPKGVLDAALEEHLFAQEVNKVTTYPTASNVYVYQVTEKAPDHAVEDPNKTTLSQKGYTDWVTEKRETLKLKEFDLTNVDNLGYLIDNAWASA